MASFEDIAANAAVEAMAVAREAEELRGELRWSVAKDDPGRGVRIEDMLDKLRASMVPVRSAIGRVAGGWVRVDPRISDVLRDASAQVQYQRKQLKKMR